MDIVSINPVSIAATVVNILVLFLIFRFFLVRPVDRILAARDEEIEQRKKDAEKAEADALALKKEYEEKMSGIGEISKAAEKEAAERGSREYDRIVSEAEKQAEEILSEAAHRAEQQERERKADSAKMIVDLVSQAAAKVAVSEENPNLDRELYDRFLQKAGEEN